jgi:hypothetical protein
MLQVCDNAIVALLLLLLLLLQAAASCNQSMNPGALHELLLC